MIRGQFLMKHGGRYDRTVTNPIRRTFPENHSPAQCRLCGGGGGLAASSAGSRRENGADGGGLSGHAEGRPAVR